MIYASLLFFLTLVAETNAGWALSGATEGDAPDPLVVRQVSFALGGAVVTAPGTFHPIKQDAYNPSALDLAGQTLHGENSYVFYQVPSNAHSLRLVMWHSRGQSAKTWETTSDGRAGFRTIECRGCPDSSSHPFRS